MSLVVAIADSRNLWIAADTRAFKTDTGPLPDPVEKIRLFDPPQGSMVIAIAGESEISGMHLFLHIENRIPVLKEDVSLNSFAASIESEWKHDIETFDWESDQDRSNYLADARITVLVAYRWNAVACLDGTFNHLGSPWGQPSN